MNQTFFQLRSFITYWLQAVDAHSLHSPFFYDFYVNVVRPGKDTIICRSGDPGPAYAQLENIRAELKRDNTVLQVNDLGAGSKHSKNSSRTVSELARYSLSAGRYAQLYHRAISHQRAEHVLELGTSLGVNTLYLALNEHTSVITMEGAGAIADVAQRMFDRCNKTNISLVRGNIDDHLNEVVERFPRIDFAFLDANHRYAPTLRYFETIIAKVHARSIVVLDDIHDSPDMERAWNAVRKHPSVTGSADLFRCGFVFFEPSLGRQHFALQI